MTRMIVVHTSEGALLKPAPVFAETRPEDVFGHLASGRAPKTLAEMQAGVLAEAMRHHMEPWAAPVRMPLHRS